MASTRDWTALALAAVLATVPWWGGASDATPGSSGAFGVWVLGPDGLLANGTVVVANATALTALQALGHDQGFAVGVESAAGFGGCDRDYVRSIAGQAETSTGGWNYYTRSAGGAWAWQSVGASCHGLRPGEQLEWCWVEKDVCAHHVP